MDDNEKELFTSLRRLVHDAIVSFPDESHRKVESFFANVTSNEDDDNENESQNVCLENVRKAWARAAVKSRAFTKSEKSGRGSVGISSDPLRFSDDFISDLTVENEAIARSFLNIQRVLSSVDKVVVAKSATGSARISPQFRFTRKK